MGDIFFEMLESEVTCAKKDIGDGIDDRPPHNHDGYEALFLMEGTAMMETEGISRQIRRGDLVLIRSGTAHHGEPEDRRRFDRVVINVQEATARTILNARPELKQVFGMNSCSGAWLCHLDTTASDEFLYYTDTLENMLKENEFGTDVLSNAYLMNLLVLVNRMEGEEVGTIDGYSFSERQELVQEMQAYIDLHIAEDLSLGKLEKIFCYSGPYLSKCFKLVTGLSLQMYIIKKRISLAKRLIREGNELKRVCDAAGFGNYSNFCRTFIRYTGFSPMDFRRKDEAVSG